MNENIKSDNELVDDAGRGVIGTPSGLPAQQAQVEMMRRLKDTIEKSNKSTDRFNQVATSLSFAMFFMTFSQIAVSLFPPQDNLARWVVFIAIGLGTVIVAYKIYYKSFIK